MPKGIREASTSSKGLGSVTVVPYLFSPTHTSKPDNPETRSPSTSVPWRAKRGAIRAEKKRKKGKGKGRLSASPAYAGEVGGIGDDSGVFVSRKQGSDLERPA